MAIFVNYYPCTYGDSLVSMFSGQNITRKNNLIDNKNHYFKFLDFYNLGPLEQTQKLSLLDNTHIYSCHRQYAFDFGTEHQIISIFPDVVDFLPNRIKQIHLDQFKKKLNHPLVEKLKDKVSIDDLIKFDCRTWARTNILKFDVVIPFSNIFDNDIMEKFCNQHNFKYNKSCIDEILTNIKQYQ
jgi:hypothetical protein